MHMYERTTTPESIRPENVNKEFLISVYLFWVAHFMEPFGVVGFLGEKTRGFQPPSARKAAGWRKAPAPPRRRESLTGAGNMTPNWR